MLSLVKNVLGALGRVVGLFPAQKRNKHIASSSTPSVLYAFHCRSNKGMRKSVTETFKVGKTVNLQQRIRPYRTIFPKGVVHHSVSSRDIDTTERWLHDALKMHGYHVEKEIFEAPPAVVTELMDVIVTLNETLFRCGKDVNKLRSLKAALQRL